MSKLNNCGALRRTAMCCAAVVVAVAFAAQAQAIHPRYRAAGLYGAGYYGPAYAGLGSFNPIGFGFGGYSYGGYPYYGYWGYLPGPYAGFSGYGPSAGPSYGLAAYGGIAAPGCPVPSANCAPACAVAPPVCDPCLMTPCAYRRYLRWTYRAMARCCLPCMPVVAPCSYGAICAAAGLVDDGGAELSDTLAGDAFESGSTSSAVEQVAPPAETPPRPGLERSF
jgi:hypothetical protein